MIACAAVDNGVGSTGIIADHAAHHRAIGGGSFRAKQIPLGFEKEIEFIAHDTGLHPHAASSGIKGKNAIQMASQINHDAMADHLTGEGCARTTGDQTGLMFAGEADEFTHVKLSCWQGDCDG